MKDKWQKDIQERMADFEVAEPEGLWAGIESARKSVGKRGGFIVSPLWRRFAVAAAMIALLLTGGLWLYLGKTDMSLPVTVPYGTDAAPIATSTPAVTSDEDAQTPPLSSSRLISHAKTPAVPSAQSAAVESGTTEVTSESKDGGSESAPTTTAAPASEKHSDKKPAVITSRRETQTVRDNYDVTSRKGSSSRLSLGVFALGGSSSTSGTVRGNKNSDMTLDNPILGDTDGEDGTNVARALPDDYINYNHRLPIRVGLTLKYDLTSRFAVESGLSYTYLGSDIKGSRSSGEQSLHYIGVPLNLKYRIASWRSFDFYASAGALVEKCVSAKFTLKENINTPLEVSKTESLDEKPLQLSVNAAAGLQWNISKTVGLYAEPGISYYFDDNTKINTIYSDRPLEFNLNFGLRFTLGSN